MSDGRDRADSVGIQCPATSRCRDRRVLRWRSSRDTRRLGEADDTGARRRLLDQRAPGSNGAAADVHTAQCSADSAPGSASNWFFSAGGQLVEPACSARSASAVFISSRTRPVPVASDRLRADQRIDHRIDDGGGDVGGMAARDASNGVLRE